MSFSIIDDSNVVAILSNKINNPVTNDLDMNGNDAVNVDAIEFNEVPSIGASTSGTSKIYVSDLDGKLHVINSEGTSVPAGELTNRFDYTSTIKLFGDSIATGANASAGKALDDLLVNEYSITINNQAISGTSIYKFCETLMHEALANPGTDSSILAYGFNDLRSPAPLTSDTRIMHWRQMYTNIAIALATPFSAKEDPNSFTQGGSWLSIVIPSNPWNHLYSNTPGDTLTKTISGRYVFVGCFYHATSTTATVRDLQVSVDGVVFADNTFDTTGMNATSSLNFPANDSAEGPYSFSMIYVDCLTTGNHSIEIQNTTVAAGAIVGVNYVVATDDVNSISNNLMMVSPYPMQHSYNTSYNAQTYARFIMFTNAIQATYKWMNRLGFKVSFSDLSELIPQSDDRIHPTNQGHRDMFDVITPQFGVAI